MRSHSLLPDRPVEHQTLRAAADAAEQRAHARLAGLRRRQAALRAAPPRPFWRTRGRARMRVLPVERRVIILPPRRGLTGFSDEGCMSDSLDTSAPRPLPAGRPEPYDTNRPPVHRRADAPAADRVRPQRRHLRWPAAGLAARILGAGGWTWVDVILFVCFAAGTPWTVLGFWNALIGLWLLHFRKRCAWPRSRPMRPPATQPRRSASRPPSS